MQELDQNLLLWFNSGHTAFLDNFAWLYTGRFIWIPFYAVIALMLCRSVGWRKALILVIVTGLCVAFADQICATVLRPIFCRPRPSRPDSPVFGLVTVVRDYRGGHYGFPSCHGANSMALAVALSLIVRRMRFSVLIFLWAAVNCWTRLYLGVHYPGDILAGAVIGSGIALAAVPPAVRRICKETPQSAVWMPAAVFGLTVGYIVIASL